MEANPIEIEFKLKKIKSQRNSQIIVQENKHIFYLYFTRKDNYKVY